MCFSTKASFGAAIVLTGLGIVALSRSKTPAQRAVALMPLLFAAQQISEGVLWISLLHSEYGYLKRTAMYTFLVFAELVWPLFIPTISLLAESNPEKRRKIGPFIAIGAGIVALMVGGMIRYPVYSEIREGHIFYDIRFPLVNYWYYGLIYFLPTILPPLLSTHKWFRILGISLLIAYAGSRVFYNHYVVSIWCYFGAMLSVVAIAMIREISPEKQESFQTSEA